MKKFLFSIALLMASAVPGPGDPAHAQDPIIDDVDTTVETEWAEIRIHFVTPVNYVRHFPQEHGQLLQIFFNITGPDIQSISLLEDTRHVPATPVIPAAVITFNPPVSLNMQRDPATLSVRFDRKVSYDVRPGDDNRSIVIYLPIVPAEITPADTSRQTPATKKH